MAGTPPIAFNVQVRERVGSTSDELRLLASRGAAHGTVLRAVEQTCGRGRQGRQWLSPPGNLYMSVLLRSLHSPRRLAEIGFAAGVAVADAVDAMLPPGRPAAVKWPNDVLVDGAKVAGILTELVDGGTPAAVVMGIGLNVAHAPAGLPYAVTCLRAHGATVSPEAACREVLAALAERWKEWSNHGFGPVRDRWRRRGPARGGSLQVHLPGEVLAGAFEDLDGDGALVLRTAGGLRRIIAGDVVSLPA